MDFEKEEKEEGHKKLIHAGLETMGAGAGASLMPILASMAGFSMGGPPGAFVGAATAQAIQQLMVLRCLVWVKDFTTEALQTQRKI
jgi:hypothetical protein